MSMTTIQLPFPQIVVVTAVPKPVLYAAAPDTERSMARS